MDCSAKVSAQRATAQALDYRRVVRIRLTDGAVLSHSEKLAAAKTPVKPYAGPQISRSESPAYVPSLDPVRIPGTVDASKIKAK